MTPEHPEAVEYAAAAPDLEREANKPTPPAQAPELVVWCHTGMRSAIASDADRPRYISVPANVQCVFLCDGCRKPGAGTNNSRGDWFKPRNWFERGDDDGTQLACSRECIEVVSKASGKTSCVLPV